MKTAIKGDGSGRRDAHLCSVFQGAHRGLQPWCTTTRKKDQECSWWRAGWSHYNNVTALSESERKEKQHIRAFTLGIQQDLRDNCVIISGQTMTFYHFYLPFSSIMLPLVFLAACEKEWKIQCGGKKAPSEEHIGHCDSYFFLLCKRDKRQPGGKSRVNKSDESSYIIIRLHKNKSEISFPT